MALTTAHIMLIDILSDRVITYMNSMKKVPSMTEEEVNAAIADLEKKKDEEMAKIEGQ